MRRKARYLIIFLTSIFIFSVLVFVSVLFIIYNKQEKIVNEVLNKVNQEIHGKLQLQSSQISILENFPYISIDFKGIELFENKNDTTSILSIGDFYAGFDFYDIINGRFVVKKVKVKSGAIDLIADTTGIFNIEKALKPRDSSTSDSINSNSSTLFKLKRIEISDLIIRKKSGVNLLEIELQINELKSSVKKKEESLSVFIDSDFLLNLNDGEKIWAKNKPIKLKTELNYNEKTSLVAISPSELILKDAVFATSGYFNIKDDLDLDIKLTGEKNDFSLLVNLLPDDLIEFMNMYKNAGKIYFDAHIKGKSIHGKQPAITARFGCKNGYFKNINANKTLDQLNFDGSFTNGDKQNSSTSEFRLNKFTAKPEQGKISASLVFRDFDDPYIDLKVNTDFELQFLADFLQLKSLEKLKGRVILNVDYNELVDFTDASLMLSKIKKEVNSQLTVKDLSFKLPNYPYHFENINASAEMKGGRLELSHLNLKVNNSDLLINGYLSDLPALFHGFDKSIDAKVSIQSNLVDLYTLTTPIQNKNLKLKEKISDFSTIVIINTNAAELKNKKALPKGYFLIDSLKANLKYYPHKIKNFTSKLTIEENDITLEKLNFEIDSTDLMVKAKLYNFKKWIENKKEGKSELQYTIESNHFSPANILTYKNQEYWPDEYKNEHLNNLSLKGKIIVNHQDDSLKSIDIVFQKASAKFSLHPLNLNSITGSIHYENQELTTKDFKIILGNSDIKLNMKYHYGTNSTKNYNSFSIVSNFLDFDELTNYEKHEIENDSSLESHAKAFNIFELPIKKYDIKCNFSKLKYHKILIENFETHIYSKEKGIISIDKMQMKIADGKIDLKGKLNGSDPKQIYFSPDFTLKNLDLNKVLIKADNFGQQYIVNENVKGILSGKINGKIKLYPDFFPIINESDLKINVEFKNGVLMNYGPIKGLSSFFGDRNLNYIRFDTLRNQFELKNNELKIPAMTINSSLGFIELSGSQNLSNNEMNYNARIPVSLITQIGANKLFGRKNKDEIPEDQIDEIIRREDQQKVRFITLNITGTNDELKIGLARRNKNK